jgi:hypothetical protein
MPPTPPRHHRRRAITVRVDKRGSRVVQDRSAAASGNLLVSVSGQGRGRSRKVIVEAGARSWGILGRFLGTWVLKCHALKALAVSGTSGRLRLQLQRQQA